MLHLHELQVLHSDCVVERDREIVRKLAYYSDCISLSSMRHVLCATGGAQSLHCH